MSYATIIILLMELLVLTAATLVAWSVWTSLRKRGKEGKVINNIPVKRLSYGVAIATLCLLLLTFLLADTTPLLINGNTYSDKLWLRLTGMFTISAIVLMVLAAGLIICGKLRDLHQEQHQQLQA